MLIVSRWCKCYWLRRGCYERCVAYEIVRLMKDGMHPQAACEKAVNMFDLELKERRGQAGDMSLVAMNNKGEWGVATNIERIFICCCYC